MDFSVSEQIIDEIKSRVDLVELISAYGIPVKRAGASVKACCPFHHEKTPSFNINPAKGYYHCFGCGESGDAISFVQKQEGLSFMEAVRKLAEQTGVKLEEKSDPELGKRKRLLALMAELAQFYHRCLLKTKEAQVARGYLKNRGISSGICEQWLIGYAPSGIATILKWAEKYKYTPEELVAAGVIKAPESAQDKGYHRFGGRLIFSIRDKQGRVVAFSGRQLIEKKNSGKYVNSPETIIFKKSRVLFGFDKAAANITKATNREAIICEGQIDTIRLHTCGFNTAVASQGTAFTEDHARMLKRVADQVLLVFDDDAAGHKATIKTARMMLSAEMPVRTINLPSGDDPDSFLRKHRPEEFSALIDRAESIIAFQGRVERAKESNPDSIDAVTRVAKAILATIVQCPSAVLRSSMIGEASKILSLPVVALNEELGKLKAEPFKPNMEAEVAGPIHKLEEDEPESVPGELAENWVEPPLLELSLAELLLANPRNEVLGEWARLYIPRKVIRHPFTWRIIEAWQRECAGGADLIASFSDSLSVHERKVFDEVLIGSSKSQASSRSVTDILQDFIRKLWYEWLVYERGQLAESEDGETINRRMGISRDLKQINMIKWSDVKVLIKRYI